MRILPTALVALAALCMAGSAYVRLAPTDAAAWHIDPRTGTDGPGSATAGVGTPLIYAETPAALLARLDAIALAAPRTQRLAGSPDTGRITYVTRSALWGFPDYTTVAVQGHDSGGAALVMFARLRFGQSDMGVNAARLEAWRAELGPAIVDAGGPGGDTDAG